MAYTYGNLYQMSTSLSFRCYICNRLIDPKGDVSKDHIIPQTIFHNEKSERPTIYVHTACNSIEKSKDDNWFTKSILYRSILNTVARNKFDIFIRSAERSRMGDITKTAKDLSNEKLLKTILQDGYLTNGIIDDNNREVAYIKMLARGLIIRHSWFIKCDILDVLSVHRPSVKAMVEKKLDKFLKASFINKLDDCIYQFWNDDVKYAINPSENLLYIEFYSQQVYLVSFDYELPPITMTKDDLTADELGAEQTEIDNLNKIWLR